MNTKLSQRVRPNSEAAPWVCDEILQMEQEIERLGKEIVTLLADNDSLRAAIDRVRALHAPVELGRGPICDECSSIQPDGWIVPYPCHTTCALDGDV